MILVDTYRLRWLLKHRESGYNLNLFLSTLRGSPSANEAEHLPSAPRNVFALENLIQISHSPLSARDTTSSKDDLLQYLLTMGKLHLAAFWQFVGNASNLSNVQLDSLSISDLKEWDRLRYELDHYQDDLKEFSRFVKREFADITRQEQLERTQELQADLLAEAQALEARFRDRFQASVGLKSLEESRRSIEEGKSVKLSKAVLFCDIQRRA